MEMKATDLSARLLATENLSVVRGRVRTASFDIKSRVLTLPMWKDMTPEVEDMLIGHEVGHALYTGEKYMEPIKENTKMMSYLNVLEDVRIEKLIKRKYPGLRKRMNEGYKQLNDRDFFGVKQVQSFDDLLLIDKINLYFKAGFQCGVKFDADEKSLVTRVERTETVEDVIALAHEIYAYSKEKAEERKQRMQQQNPQDEEEEIEWGEDFDPEYDDMDGMDEDEMDVPNNNSPTKQSDDRKDEDEESDLESKTERAFRNKLDDLADETTEYNYWKFNPYQRDNVVVDYKTILSETKSNEQWMLEDRIEVDRESKEFNTFKTDSMRTVNYLVKEFEMRKSAKLYKRSQVSKIGSLDMRKVYAYQLQDDLFKRVTTVPQGKNHGMIMLVDWSGSMSDVIYDTLKQVINLAMFCNRVQIPYRVLAFSSEYYSTQDQDQDKLDQKAKARRDFIRELAANKEKILDSADHFYLLEFFSSKMTTSEFNSMAKRILDRKFFWNKGYSLGGTPLNESLVWVYQNIGSFIKNNQIEKMTFITLTDGEGGSIGVLNGRSSSLDEIRTEVVDNTWKRIRQKHFIRDEKTQNTYEFSRDSGKQANTILSMIKDRYGISIVGFHICENRRGDLNAFLRSSLPEFDGDRYSVIEKWRKDFRSSGFASIKNTGRDDLFLIPQASTKIVEGEMEVNADANAKSIAKNFGKYLNVKKTSRVLLSRFVGLVA